MSKLPATDIESRPGEYKAKNVQGPKLTRKARELAAQTGLLPHEILLRIARGEVLMMKRPIHEKYASGPRKGQIKSTKWVDFEYYPDFSERIDAAKSAAPFYAPRLNATRVQTDEKLTDTVVELMKELSKGLPV